MLEHDISNAWRQASSSLGIIVMAPHRFDAPFDALEVEAFLPHFGGPKGTVVLADRRSPDVFRGPFPPGIFVSRVSEHYRAFEPRLFQETLNDWGWFGPEGQHPSWYTGQPWSDSG